MFSNCESLSSFSDISNWNTKKVIDMSSMFSCCSSLVSIDLSNLDTSKVTDMSHMFDGCTSFSEVKMKKKIFYHSCQKTGWHRATPNYIRAKKNKIISVGEMGIGICYWPPADDDESNKPNEPNANESNGHDDAESRYG
jgi:surface protein